ncbi:hypothetical protein TSARBOMBA_186 [Bacillus phage TsarBomba]|uniref:Uncharacterized protein n=1 Tax=Bacillus phage TsarBomba TaxID=1690456 RepID=A0A0K2D068_9CAUD|nr:hypothetical protein TSARBOMBA_186 [Bacillus phage TsarBomba]ALA13219.1 hypothetical protein TSARBOMBA_186 [Bacillus phage TsarBomba]
MAEGYVSLWMLEGELHDYLKGNAACAFQKKGEYHIVNVLIPLSHIKSSETHENNDGSTDAEFWIQKPVVIEAK